MCLDGVTYCVNAKNIDKKLACGYTLGPCDMQQSEACNNSTTSESPSCECSGKLVSVTFRYVGPSYEDISVAGKKKCKIPLGDFTNVMTGDEITIDASDAGLDYLRKDTYFEWVGVGRYKIPTNCCNNPIGQNFFPFEVIAWTDTDGNECGTSAAKNSSAGNMEANEASTELEQAGATIVQYPNPAQYNATFEFTVTDDQAVTVSIFNIRGELLDKVYNGHAEGMKTYRINYNVSNIESGIYFIHLSTSDKVFKKKFIVLR